MLSPCQDIHQVYSALPMNINNNAWTTPTNSRGTTSNERGTSVVLSPPDITIVASSPSPPPGGLLPSSSSPPHHRQSATKPRVTSPLAASGRRGSLDTEQGEFIALPVSTEGLGFTVGGGSDGPHAAVGDRSIRVTSIVPGTPADHDGRLHVDDRVCAFNHFRSYHDMAPADSMG